MDSYQEVWDLALPYLHKGVRKDFVIHTQGVVRAMELLLEKEEGDTAVLLPAAILHDVGWAEVPHDIQHNWRDPTDKRKGEKLHLIYASEIISDILKKLGYRDHQIDRIIEVVRAHKFQDPSELEKQLLIDADGVSDAFKDQFYRDIEIYENTPEQFYEFRMRDCKFYTVTAKEIFEREMAERKKEFTSSEVSS